MFYFTISIFKNGAPLFFLFVLSCLMGCQEGNKRPVYKIAFDPSWHSIEIPGKQLALTAFTMELVMAIAKAERKQIALYETGWSNLMIDLEKGRCDAICTSLKPRLFYVEKFTFSEPYLMTGPVVVVPTSSQAISIKMLKNKVVGVVRDTTGELIVAEDSDITPALYDSIPNALLDTAQGTIDGCIVDGIIASGFVKDLFHGTLKIISPPMTDEGIRFVALQDRNSEWIAILNRGISKLKGSQVYFKMLQKWGLSDDELGRLDNS